MRKPVTLTITMDFKVTPYTKTDGCSGYWQLSILNTRFNLHIVPCAKLGLGLPQLFRLETDDCVLIKHLTEDDLVKLELDLEEIGEA